MDDDEPETIRMIRRCAERQACDIPGWALPCISGGSDPSLPPSRDYLPPSDQGVEGVQGLPDLWA